MKKPLVIIRTLLRVLSAHWHLLHFKFGRDWPKIHFVPLDETRKPVTERPSLCRGKPVPLQRPSGDAQALHLRVLRPIVIYPQHSFTGLYPGRHTIFVERADNRGSAIWLEGTIKATERAQDIGKRIGHYVCVEGRTVNAGDVVCVDTYTKKSKKGTLFFGHRIVASDKPDALDDVIRALTLQP